VDLSATAEDLAVMAFAAEPGRCCFFGEGCGAKCGSFADEGNFCAGSRDACEGSCGKEPGEFTWCPLENEDAAAARHTALCNASTAEATFSEITLSGY
jgi:hypothetical protein